MIEVAKILKPQGIKGEIKAQPLTNVVKVFDVLTECLVGNEIMHIKHISFRQGFLYIKFDEINSRNDAENYRNKNILIEKELLSNAKNDDEFLIDDLIGMLLYDEKGNLVGQILSVENYGASDIIIIEKEGRQYQIPYVEGVFFNDDGTLKINTNKLLEVMI